MFYYNETNEACSMFATDDTTQKFIIVPGQCADAIDAIFETKTQRKMLKELAETKLDLARVRPFRDMKDEEKAAIVKELLNHEYEIL